MSDSVEAELFIEVWAKCPLCEDPIDLMIHNNDEGQVIRQACPSNGIWVEEHKKFEVSEVTCNNCGHVFDVKGLVW